VVAHGGGGSHVYQALDQPASGSVGRGGRVERLVDPFLAAWPPEFADAFRDAVYHDLDHADDHPDGSIRAAREQDELYHQYASTEDMLNAVTIRC
jgi:hypothetical protein